MKQTIFKALHIIGRVLFVCLKFAVQTMVKIDRYFWKRYLNIETPLYKLWWSNHVEYIQNKLDEVRHLREKGTLFDKA